MLTPSEALTANFYAWERNGRGWARWEGPVRLEPVFRPFTHVGLVRSNRDDARTHTLWSKFGDFVRAGFRDSAPSAPIAEITDSDSAVPEPFSELEPVSSFVASLPQSESVNTASVRGFLLACSAARYPLSFELVGGSEAIVAQFAYRTSDERVFRDQFEAHFSGASLSEAEDELARGWSARGGTAAVLEFGLAREFMVSLELPRGLEPDPLIPIVGALSSLGSGEVGVMQVLAEPTTFPWAEHALRAVTDGAGRPFFRDAPEITARARDKLERPLFAAVLRLAAKASNEERAWEILRGLAGGLLQFGAPGGNSLIALSNDDAPALEGDLLRRVSHRSGMLLSIDELTALVHPPSGSVVHPKLLRETRVSKLPPREAVIGGTVIGECTHRGVSTSVSVRVEDRLRHVHVIGASGTGKSTLLLSMILQDIEAGHGVALLDPHGDLAEDVLARVPESRVDQVVLLDPSEAENALGLNVLSASSERERAILSSDLVATFRRLSTSWGDQMTAVLGNAVEAFLESDLGGSLADLRRFLVEKDYRDSFLESVRDPNVVYYWRKEFPLLVGKPQGPILTRLDAFLRPKVIRAMVEEHKNGLDLRQVVERGEVLIVKLAEGLIGEENAALLGSLLVSKFHQVAMGRQEMAAEDRRPFFLYLDEFHHFATPSMGAMLTGARKYGLGLTLAHQELRQLQAKDPDVASAVLSNAGTRICFRVGDHDARTLESGFAAFDARSLQTLSTGEAICRIGRADADFRVRTRRIESADHSRGRSLRQRIAAAARERRRVTSPPPHVEEERSRPSTLQPAVSKTIDASPVAKPARAAEPSKGITQGRGGAQHKYLQELIRRCAQSLGFLASIEEPILDGQGCVDVALRRGGQTIACEIAVSSRPVQEVGHIRNCFAAGFDQVIAVSLERSVLRKIQAALPESLTAEEVSRVHCMTPEEAMAHLEGSAFDPAESSVRGYTVRVSLAQTTQADRQRRGKVLADVIAKTVRRLKGH